MGELDIVLPVSHEREIGSPKDCRLSPSLILYCVNTLTAATHLHVDGDFKLLNLSVRVLIKWLPQAVGRGKTALRGILLWSVLPAEQCTSCGICIHHVCHTLATLFPDLPLHSFPGNRGSQTLSPTLHVSLSLFKRSMWGCTEKSSGKSAHFSCSCICFLICLHRRHMVHFSLTAVAPKLWHLKKELMAPQFAVPQSRITVIGIPIKQLNNNYRTDTKILQQKLFSY